MSVQAPARSYGRSAQDLRPVTKHDRAGASENHARAGVGLLQQHLLGRAAEVLVNRQLIAHRHRRTHVLADEAAQQTLDPARAQLLVVLVRELDIDLEPVCDGERDRAIEKWNPEALGERWPDATATGPVCGREGYEHPTRLS